MQCGRFLFCFTNFDDNEKAAEKKFIIKNKDVEEE